MILLEQSIPGVSRQLGTPRFDTGDGGGWGQWGGGGGLRSKHSESTALSLLPLCLLPRHFSSSWCIHIIVRTYTHTLHTLDDPTGVVHSWPVTCVFFLSSFIRSVISPDPFTGTERVQCLLEISMILILILNRNSLFSILVNESGLIATDQSEAFYMSWILRIYRR